MVALPLFLYRVSLPSRQNKNNNSIYPPHPAFSPNIRRSLLTISVRMRLSEEKRGGDGGPPRLFSKKLSPKEKKGCWVGLSPVHTVSSGVGRREPAPLPPLIPRAASLSPPPLPPPCSPHTRMTTGGGGCGGGGSGGCGSGECGGGADGPPLPSRRYPDPPSRTPACATPPACDKCKSAGAQVRETRACVVGSRGRRASKTRHSLPLPISPAPTPTSLSIVRRPAPPAAAPCAGPAWPPPSSGG